MVTFKNRKVRLNFAGKHLKELAQLWKKSLDRWNREKQRNSSWSKHNTSVKHDGGNAMAWTCMAASGSLNNRLVFIDDRSIRVNCEVYRAMLSAQIQPNAAKLLIGQRFTVQMDKDPKQTKRGKYNILWLQLTSFSVTKNKTEGRDPQTSSSLNNVWWCPWVLHFSDSLTAKY